MDGLKRYPRQTVFYSYSLFYDPSYVRHGKLTARQYDARFAKVYLEGLKQNVLAMHAGSHEKQVMVLQFDVSNMPNSLAIDVCAVVSWARTLLGKRLVAEEVCLAVLRDTHTLPSALKTSTLGMMLRGRPACYMLPSQGLVTRDVDCVVSSNDWTNARADVREVRGFCCYSEHRMGWCAQGGGLGVFRVQLLEDNFWSVLRTAPLYDERGFRAWMALELGAHFDWRNCVRVTRMKVNGDYFTVSNVRVDVDYGRDDETCREAATSSTLPDACEYTFLWRQVGSAAVDGLRWTR